MVGTYSRDKGDFLGDILEFNEHSRQRLTTHYVWGNFKPNFAITPK